MSNIESRLFREFWIRLNGVLIRYGFEPVQSHIAKQIYIRLSYKEHKQLNKLWANPIWLKFDKKQNRYIEV